MFIKTEDVEYRISLDDIKATAQALLAVKERTRWLLVASCGSLGADVFVRDGFMTTLAGVVGQEIQVSHRGPASPHYSWEGSVHYGGVKFYDIYTDADLHTIGYEVVDGTPVRINPEKEDTDAD